MLIINYLVTERNGKIHNFCTNCTLSVHNTDLGHTWPYTDYTLSVHEVDLTWHNPYTPLTLAYLNYIVICQHWCNPQTLVCHSGFLGICLGFLGIRTFFNFS